LGSIDEVAEMMKNNFKFQILGNVDPNKNNIVATGIFHSDSNQAILIRIETNMDKGRRFTLKSTDSIVADQVFDAIEENYLNQ